MIYYVGSAGLRLNFVIEKVLEVFLLGGLDFHYYKPAAHEVPSSRYQEDLGFHLGFGGFFPVSRIIKLRGELKFHNSPGKSIYIGVGPTILF